MVLGRVIKKDRKHICLEHWQIDATSKEENTIAKKCSGCIAGKRNDTSCLVRLKNDSWHQVIEKVHNSNESLCIKAPLSAYREAKEMFNGEIAENLRRVEISLVGLEEAIIQRVIKNEEIQKELDNIAKILIEKKEVIIYTDSSLVLERKGEREEKKIGLG